MKVFKVTAENATFDEYISMVVIAESKDRALDIALNEKQPFNQGLNEKKYDVFFEFEEHQMPLKVDEIDTTKESIVVSEFLGG